MPINVSADKIVRIDGLVLGERMIARQDYDKRLLRHQFVFEIGLLLPAEESDIKLPALRGRLRALSSGRSKL